MKSLALGIVLILLIGLGGFFYRNVVEHGVGDKNEPIACTADAKLCPDGSAVGREGPRCEFPACPFPNVELEDARFSFLAPPGYVRAPGSPDTDDSVLLELVKPALSEANPHSITVRHLLPVEGKKVEELMLEHTRYQPADMQAQNFEKFDTLLINGKEIRTTVVERFEGIVHSVYFLTREQDMLMFEVIEQDVTEWTNPDLVISELPEHKALLELLGSLQMF